MTATATYRMPRERGEASRILSLTWDGETARMAGGRFGAHEITTADPEAVRAHWYGYVSNNRGRKVTPPVTFHWLNTATTVRKKETK
jgi:hypothetical protein